MTNMPAAGLAEWPGFARINQVVHHQQSVPPSQVADQFTQRPFLNTPKESSMGVLVTKPAPDFKATAVMPDGQFKE
ncbi:MAG: hypothetical protein NXI22_22375, partial [bacterium]|nr:hypothetical protein [bacterium]